MNSMNQEFQYSIKLWLFDDQIIFNKFLCCSSSTDKQIKLFDDKFHSGCIL